MDASILTGLGRHDKTRYGSGQQRPGRYVRPPGGAGPGPRRGGLRRRRVAGERPMGYNVLRIPAG